MINRANKQLVDQYAEHRKKIDHLDPKSLRLEKTWSVHLLTWADESPFRAAPKITTTFPEYVAGLGLAPEYQRKLVSYAHRFFIWLKIHVPGHRSITELWLETFKLGRFAEELKDVESVSLEEILAIARAPVETLREERIRAAACFLYLSGMRVGAFVSLPIKAVDIVLSEIQQDPALGVRTKFKKAAVTFLYSIPELHDVILAWDCKIRSVLSPDSPWFAPISPATGELDPNYVMVGMHRDDRFRQDLQDWLKRVNLPYHSPHKFRYGHALYGIENSDDMADFKAVMENLMHESLSQTEKYSRLRRTDAKRRITQLGASTSQSAASNSADRQMLGVLERLEAVTQQLEELKK